MSVEAILVVVIWLVTGAAIALVMSRRGHTLGRWLLLSFLGPLLALFALTEQDLEPEAAPERLSTGAAADGGAHVLIGIDGSDEARAALDSVAALFGDRLGRVSLASVVDYETVLYPDTSDEPEVRARRWLAEARDHLARTHGVEAATTVLAGEPARALLDFGRAEGADLVAAGTRGRGLTKRLLGSVATRLAQSHELPVLLVGTPHPSNPGTE